MQSEKLIIMNRSIQGSVPQLLIIIMLPVENIKFSKKTIVDDSSILFFCLQQVRGEGFKPKFSSMGDSSMLSAHHSFPLLCLCTD